MSSPAAFADALSEFDPLSRFRQAKVAPAALPSAETSVWDAFEKAWAADNEPGRAAKREEELVNKMLREAEQKRLLSASIPPHAHAYLLAFSVFANASGEHAVRAAEADKNTALAEMLAEARVTRKRA